MVQFAIDLSLSAFCYRHILGLDLLSSSWDGEKERRGYQPYFLEKGHLVIIKEVCLLGGPILIKTSFLQS